MPVSPGFLAGSKHQFSNGATILPGATSLYNPPFLVPSLLVLPGSVVSLLASAAKFASVFLPFSHVAYTCSAFSFAAAISCVVAAVVYWVSVLKDNNICLTSTIIGGN